MFSPTLLLLALSTSSVLAYPQAGSVDPNFVCPVADMMNTKCMGPKDCLYPDDNNCAGFIQCQPKDGYQTGIAYRMDCSVGLRWNDNAKWCDYPANATCTPHEVY